MAHDAVSHEVRKTVTVVFADVTGSTGLGERLDPESVRRIMIRYFDEMRAVVERHDGTVEKFIGDAVMAVFGIARVHEDDALRAVLTPARSSPVTERPGRHSPWATPSTSPPGSSRTPSPARSWSGRRPIASFATRLTSRTRRS